MRAVQKSPLNKYEGSSAPSNSDDGTKGYMVGSRWYTSTTIYRCNDASTSAAIWVIIGAGSSGGGVEITESLYPGVIALITDSSKYNDAYGNPGATLGGEWNAAVPSGPSEHDYYIETPNNDGLPKHVITFLKKSGTLKPNRIPYIY